MPCIVRLDGLKVYIYVDDENPPHFHILGGETNVKVRISDLQVIQGEYSPSELRRVLRWAAENQDLLLSKWSEYNERD